MPSTVRFLTILLAIAAAIYAAMFALATLVSPRQAEISERITLPAIEPAKPVEESKPEGQP